MSGELERPGGVQYTCSPYPYPLQFLEFMELKSHILVETNATDSSNSINS